MKAKHFSSEAKVQKPQRKFSVKKVQSRAVIDCDRFFKTKVQSRAVGDGIVTLRPLSGSVRLQRICAASSYSSPVGPDLPSRRVFTREVLQPKNQNQNRKQKLKRQNHSYKIAAQPTCSVPEKTIGHVWGIQEPNMTVQPYF